MRLIFLLSIFSLVFFSCQRKTDKNIETLINLDSEAMITEALDNAKNLEKATKAKGEALAVKAQADVERIAKENEAIKAEAKNAIRMKAKQQEAALQYTPNKALSKYNGFYLDDRNQHGAFIFVDGKLSYFDCKEFKSVYKNEEYNIAGITNEGYFDIVAKYKKNREGEVYAKATVLRDVKPILSGTICVKLERGYDYIRMKSLRDFIDAKNHYPMESFLADFKAKYNRTDAEIQNGLDNQFFYKCDFFTRAPFYGDQMPWVDALESIIKM